VITGKNVHAFSVEEDKVVFFTLLENWAIAAYRKGHAHVRAVS